MKVITINSKEYVIEFTIEASLYNACTEKVTGLMMKLSEAQDKKDIKELLGSMSDIPQTALTMFYAGLLEHHGEDGDGSVTSIKDAKKLIKEYIAENKDDETGNFYGVMEMLIDQMAEDGFFKQIGLEQLMNQTEEEDKQKAKTPKVPQDHKKKATKPKENQAGEK